MQGVFLHGLRDRDPLHDRQVKDLRAGRLRRHRSFRRQRLDRPRSRHEDSERAVQLRTQARSTFD